MTSHTTLSRRRLLSLGASTKAAGSYNQALGHLEEAIGIRRQLLAAAPALPELQANLARTLMVLGNTYKTNNQRDLAESSHKEALALFLPS